MSITWTLAVMQMQKLTKNIVLYENYQVLWEEFIFFLCQICSCELITAASFPLICFWLTVSIPRKRYWSWTSIKHKVVDKAGNNPANATKWNFKTYSYWILPFFCWRGTKPIFILMFNMLYKSFVALFSPLLCIRQMLCCSMLKNTA